MKTIERCKFCKKILHRGHLVYDECPYCRKEDFIERVEV